MPEIFNTLEKIDLHSINSLCIKHSMFTAKSCLHFKTHHELIWFIIALKYHED